MQQKLYIIQLISSSQLKSIHSLLDVNLNIGKDKNQNKTAQCTMQHILQNSTFTFHDSVIPEILQQHTSSNQ